MRKKKKSKKAKKTKKVKTKIKTLALSKSQKKEISVSNSDEKPEIQKIKKQPTEKRIYNLKDYVVYPKHGVGKITAIEKATIGEIDIQFYKILVEKEKLTLTVPINQQSKLRPIASTNQINKFIAILKLKPKIKRTMWSRIAQEYDKIALSGETWHTYSLFIPKDTPQINSEWITMGQFHNLDYHKPPVNLDLVGKNFEIVTRFLCIHPKRFNKKCYSNDPENVRKIIIREDINNAIKIFLIIM